MSSMKDVSLFYYQSPLGWLKLSAVDSALIELAYISDDEVDEDLTKPTQKLFKQASSQLDEYFSGKRKKFEIKLAPKGTQFQERVWFELQQIPHGQTASYKDIAEKIEKPKAIRAVGTANGKNPIPIIIPCHRVISADGGWGGYSSGVDKKKWLLQHEQ